MFLLVQLIITVAALEGHLLEVAAPPLLPARKALLADAFCEGGDFGGSDTASGERGGSCAGEALGLVQKALVYKRSEVRLATLAGGTAQAATAAAATMAAAKANLTAAASAQQMQRRCAELGGIGLSASIGAPPELKVMSVLGVVGDLDACAKPQTPQPFGGGLLQTWSVETKNKLTVLVSIAWICLATSLVAWSVYGVARVPSKHAEPGLKTELANDTKAWEEGFFSWLSMSWADDLMGRYGKCWRASIDDGELSWDTNARHGKYEPYELFREEWDRQVEAGGFAKASLLHAATKVMGLRACLGLFFACCLDIFMSNIAQVVVLEVFMNQLVAMGEYHEAHPEEPRSYLEASLIIFIGVFGLPMLYRSASILVTLIDGYYTQMICAGLASVVFEKALALPAGCAPRSAEDPDDEDQQHSSTPNVIQIVNVDIIMCWSGLFKAAIMLVLSPLMILILLSMLVARIHFAGLVGFLYCVPAVTITILLAQVNIGFWKKQQGWQDKRLKKLSETIVHIRALKSLALEALSAETLDKARHAELDSLQSGTIVGGFTLAIGTSIPWGCVLLAMYVLILKQGSVSAVEILIIQRLMGSLLLAVAMLSGSIHKLVSVPNSFARVKRFLAQPSRPKSLAQPVTSRRAEDQAPVVQLRGSFTFVQGMPAVLKDLDLSVHRGDLVAVIGAVASGKSALLQAVIGELYPVGADALVTTPDHSSGKLAYCSQVPWIFEGTLRENVVLNASFEHARYYQALYAAALAADLDILPGGDQVAIGSYGIRLSGGQRARVSLARAAYMDAELVVMDDPFASVDVATGQHIHEELLTGSAMRGRTRIVATQPNPRRLMSFDKVLLMEGGRIVESGTPEKVLASAAFARLKEQHERQQSKPVAKRSEVTWTFGAEAVAKVCERKMGEQGTSLRDVEDQDHITFETIRWWMRAAGFWNLFVFFGGVLMNRTLDLAQSVVLATWINSKMDGEVDDFWYMRQIIIRVLGTCSCQVFTMWAASRVSKSASKAVHTAVVSSLLRAPIDRFFDKQPVGRLINRLSADMSTTDNAVPWAFSSMLSFTIGFLITECFILNIMPWRILLCAVPFVAVALWFIYIFHGTIMPMLFAQKFAMSRLHDLQTVCLTSNVSVRANGMLQDFIQRFNEQSATVIKCSYLSSFVCVAWVQSRIFLCMSVLVTIFAMCGLWADMPIGTLSIIIVLSLNQMAQFEGLSQLLTGAMNILNALQRLTRYSSIPQEAPTRMPNDPVVRLSVCLEPFSVRPLEVRTQDDSGFGLVSLCLKGQDKAFLLACPDGQALAFQSGFRLRDWAPTCGAMDGVEGCYYITAVNGITKDAKLMAEELCNPPSSLWLELWRDSFAAGVGVLFDGVTAGYSLEKPVLHSVSFDIAPRMKVGIAGTTGCGKSTTLLCLLRVLEARSGRIFVGNLDTKQMGLQLLRTLVGLVPQDATVFQGSWRYNLDPFHEFPDGRVWEALRCSHLMAFVRALPQGLESEIAEDGANLSFGQKQLLSLARMVIRQPPVLLLDECTSALDPQTQKSVQSTVLGAFPKSTILSVAHRVETLLDFDRVLVFDKGTVVENGTVKEVLEIEGGWFARMVKAADV